MSNRKFYQLFIVLAIASVLIIGATQKFDTLQAKNLITTSSKGVSIKNDGTLNLASGAMTLAAGNLAVTAGNLTVGSGTPTFTQDGSDTFLGGTVELGDDLILTPQTSITVVASTEFTPTGFYQPLVSLDLAQTVADIATPTDDTTGKTLLLHNINATFPITIDGTGLTVECKADVELGPQDMLTLLWNGTNWVCISSYDNS